MEAAEQAELIKTGRWREWVSNEARSWLGTPYVPKGRIKGLGVDCGALLYEIYNPLFGPFKNFPTNYAPDWAAHSPNELYLDFIMPYVHEVDEARVGGFALFHFGLAYSHAAIYVGQHQFIHAWGRLREGRVTQTHDRVLKVFAKTNEFPVRFFDPVIK